LLPDGEAVEQFVGPLPAIVRKIIEPTVPFIALIGDERHPVAFVEITDNEALGMDEHGTARSVKVRATL
jgi:hypothetical protein